MVSRILLHQVRSLPQLAGSMAVVYEPPDAVPLSSTRAMETCTGGGAVGWWGQTRIPNGACSADNAARARLDGVRHCGDRSGVSDAAGARTCGAAVGRPVHALLAARRRHPRPSRARTGLRRG